MRYLLAHHIRGDAAGYYVRLTKDLEKRFGIPSLSRRSPAHITLKPPFETDDLEPVIGKLTQVSAFVPQLPLKIRGFETFRQKTIYLDVPMTPELQQWGTELASECAGLVDGRAIPLPIKMHISVARKLAPGLYQRVMRYLGTLPIPEFDSVFDSVTLFQYVNNKWVVHRVFELSGPQP
ncbi:MAG TPA: 2'-5' RNA ligase family protein [Candidatus Paceibacterota bacterium]|jgi:2'-5' RNA ligase